MPNEYVRHVKVTVTGKTGVKSRLFQLESGEFLPTSAVMQFIKDCDFDYILDIIISHYTYKLVKVDENKINEQEAE